MRRIAIALLTIALCACTAPLKTIAPAPSPPPISTPTATPTPEPMPTPTPTPLIYVVQPGDTLFSIASQYGITIEALCEANDLEDCNLIYPGDELIIPGEGGPSPTPKAEQPAQIAAPAANPRDLGATSAEGQAELVIANDSPYLLTLEFTGPITQTITVEPCPDCEEYAGFGPIVCPPGRPDTTFRLSPGTYEVTAKVSQADITPFSATWELEADHSYSQCFYAVSEFE